MCSGGEKDSNFLLAFCTLHHALVFAMALLQYSQALPGDTLGSGSKESKRLLDYTLITDLMERATTSEIITGIERLLLTHIFGPGVRYNWNEGGTKEPFDDDVERFVKRTVIPVVREGFRLGYKISHYVITYEDYPNGPKPIRRRPMLRPYGTYVVGYRVTETGKVLYDVYPRDPNLGSSVTNASVLDDQKPLTDCRLFWIEEPTIDGRVSSPIQRALPSIKRLEELWSNLEAADRWRAHPPWVERDDGDKTGGAAAKNPIHDLKFGEADAGMEDAVSESMQRNAISEAESAAARQRADASNEPWIRSVLDRRRRQFVKEVQRMPWDVQFPLPPGHRLEPAPQPQTLPQFNETARMLIAQIATATGVSPMMFAEGNVTHAANVELARSMLDDAARTWQDVLTTHLEAIFMDMVGDWLDEYLETKVKDLVNMPTINRLLTDEEIDVVRNDMFVTAEFAPMPTRNYEQLRQLWTDKVISTETFKRLALQQHNLGLEYMLTAEQEDAERTLELKRKRDELEMQAEVAAKAGGGGGASDKKGAAKKAKKSSGAPAASTASPASSSSASNKNE